MNSTVSSHHNNANVGSNVSRWGESSLRRGEQVAMERAHTAELAHHLSTVALQQWEKTLTGIVALPAAAALGIAATATYGVALLERGFEVFESAVGSVGRTLTYDRHDHHMMGGTDQDRNEARS